MSSFTLILSSVSLSLPNETLIDQLDRKIGPGEILTLMGPSGSGKSTLLSFIAGVLPPTIHATGSVSLGGRTLDKVPTSDRRVGILFQDPLLFPHMSVGENLAFALPHRIKGTARRNAVESALDRAELSGYSDRDPTTLSGGQQSRVSLLRTVLAEPEALLLDEPYSRLDQALRDHFREFIQTLVTEAGLPTVLVTHDPADAPPGGDVLQMADLKQQQSTH